MKMLLNEFNDHLNEINKQFSIQLAEVLGLSEQKQITSENEIRSLISRNVELLRSLAELNLYMANISKNWDAIFKILYIDQKLPVSLIKFFNFTLYHERNGNHLMDRVGKFDHEITVIDAAGEKMFEQTPHEMMQLFARGNTSLIQVYLTQQLGKLNYLTAEVSNESHGLTHREEVLLHRILVKAGLKKDLSSKEMKEISQERYRKHLSLTPNSKTEKYKTPENSEIENVIRIISEKHPELIQDAQKNLRSFKK
jgi:hypothetical protein